MIRRWLSAPVDWTMVGIQIVGSIFDAALAYCIYLTWKNFGDGVVLAILAWLIVQIRRDK